MLSCVDTGKKSLHKIIEAIEYVSHKRFFYFYDHSLASIHNLTSIASNAFLAVSCLFNAFIWSIHKFFVVYCHLSHGHVKQCFVDLLFEFSISAYDSCYLTTAIFFFNKKISIYLWYCLLNSEVQYCQVLSDDKKRALYDQYGEAGVKSTVGGPSNAYTVLHILYFHFIILCCK